MSKRAWMPLYVGDYLGDTGHLTTTQHGAYFLLMMHYWRKGGLPNDDKQLCKITKLPLKVWTEWRETMIDFFYEFDGDPWRHKRIDAELLKMMKVSEARAIAGQKGGIGSALSRMKLEGVALSKHVPRQAIARQVLSKAAANVDHSHSHKNITTTAPVDTKGLGGGGADGSSIQISTELAAIMARAKG